MLKCPMNLEHHRTVHSINSVLQKQIAALGEDAMYIFHLTRVRGKVSAKGVELEEQEVAEIVTILRPLIGEKDFILQFAICPPFQMYERHLYLDPILEQLEKVAQGGIIS